MLGALLLLLIGSADVIRSGLRRPTSVILVVLLWGAIVALGVTGLGIPVWWLVIPVVLALAWIATTSSAVDVRTPAGILPAVGVLLALLAFLVWDRTALNLDGYIVDWHSTTASSVLRELPLPALVLGLGAVLFLVESANIVVRAALRPAEDESPRANEVVRRRLPWERRAPVETIADLRGGRLIGPVERILIVALTLSGSFPVVAGLIAAKGIVRFPEISKDEAGGSKAEYFLVGSLVSWGVAVAAAGLLWIAGQG